MSNLCYLHDRDLCPLCIAYADGTAPLPESLERDIAVLEGMLSADLPADLVTRFDRTPALYRHVAIAFTAEQVTAVAQMLNSLTTGAMSAFHTEDEYLAYTAARLIIDTAAMNLVHESRSSRRTEEADRG